MSAHAALFRIYRPIIIPFAVLVVLAHVIVVSIIIKNTGDIGFSMWLILVGSAAKYWLLVVGIILVAMQLRQFVANGVTRHEFLAGVGVFGLIMAVGFAAAVGLGHGLESAVLGWLGKRGDGYPVIGPGGMLADFGQVLPAALGYAVSGALIAAGFYRWKPWIGVAVMIGGAIPAVVADGLFGVNEFGHAVGRLPYAAALPLSLAVTAIGAAAFHRAISDVAIRRTAG